MPRKPVFTGIGHTGDETVADIVAAGRCITPTECGQETAWPDRPVVGGARGAAPAGLARRVPAFLADAQARDTAARGRLTAAARQQLRVHRERLARAPPQSVEWPPRARWRVQAAVRPRPPASVRWRRAIWPDVERVQSWRRLLAAYDVDRQLERGYSLTHTAAGDLVRSAAGLAEGDGDRDPVRRRDGAQPSRGDRSPK